MLTSSGARPLDHAKCPSCGHEIEVALPLLDPPPESVKITSADETFESTWLARLVEDATCPSCRNEIKVWWYGGLRW